MKEELQIEQAARLADTKAPENLSTARARSFVNETIGKRNFFFSHPVMAWGGSVVAFAVAAAVAVVLILPVRETSNPVSVMQEVHSVHASSETADTTMASAADTLSSFELPTVDNSSE